MRVQKPREEELKQPVGDYMRREGYEVYFEVPFKGKKPDVVCVDQDQDCVVTMELKVEKWRVALRQASLCSLWSTKAYAVFPDGVSGLIEKNRESFEEEGVGVMLVDLSLNRVSEILEPDGPTCDPIWKSNIIDVARQKGNRFVSEGR